LAQFATNWTGKMLRCLHPITALQLHVLHKKCSRAELWSLSNTERSHRILEPFKVYPSDALRRVLAPSLDAQPLLTLSPTKKLSLLSIAVLPPGALPRQVLPCRLH